MRSRVALGTCLAMAACWSIAVAAQDPTVQKTPTESLRITGCIEKAAASAAPASTERKTSTDNRFVLTKAMASPAAAAGTASAKPVANQMKAASEYRLDGSDSMLAPYVGHKVQIVGNPEAARTKTAGSSSAPTLLVDSVQLLSQTCS